jgi:hypothetical protein
MTGYPDFPRELQARVFVDGAWVDITTYVLGRAGLTLRSGMGSETTSITRSTCTGELNNRDGRFSPRNPDSPYFEQLALNTPIEITTKVITDTFTRSASSSWGSTPNGLAYSTFGAGGVLNASDYNVAAGVGTHSVPAAAAYRATYLADHVYRDIDVTVDVSLPITNITGAGVTLGVILRGQSTSTYYLATATVLVDETIELGWEHSTDGTIATPVVVPDLVHASSQTLRLRVQVEGNTLHMKAWPASQGEPYEWPLVESDVFGTPLLTAGFVGLMTRVETGNSNATPVVASWDNLTVRIPEAAMEIADWPSSWDQSGTDVWVPFTAADILQRYSDTTAVLADAPTRYLPTYGDTLPGGAPVAYWPLGGGRYADALRPQVGASAAVLTSPLAPSAHLGQGRLASWLTPCVAMFGGDFLSGSVSMPTFDEDNGWMVHHARLGGRGGDTRFTIGCAGNVWILTFRPSTLDILVQPPVSGSVVIAAPNLFDDALHHVGVSANWEAGTSSVVWGISADDEPLGGASASASSGDLRAVTSWTIHDLAAHTEPFAVGHVVVHALTFSSSFPSACDALFGFRGETAAHRAARLADEEGIDFAQGGVFGTNEVGPDLMGPQRPARLITLWEECTAGGVLFVPRGVVGIGFRPQAARQNPAAALTVDYALGEVDAIDPADDRFGITNKVTASRPDGGSAVAELTTGRYSTLSPPAGGIGEKASTLTVNALRDTQLPHHAGWAVRLGTVDEPRLTSLGLQLGNARYRTASGAQARAAAAHVLREDDQVVITNPKSVLGPDPLAQLVRGVERRLNRMVHEVVVNTTPASPYEVLTIEDTTRGRVHTDGSELAVGVDGSATAWSVASLAGRPWSTTAEPYDVRAGGEVVTVTACADEVMSGIVTGTVAHGNNASVAPGLPAGHAAGNLLLCLAAIRNSGAGVPSGCVASSGEWNRWPVFEAASNVQLFAKIDNGAEAAPTVSFTGGVAGADTSAQLIKVAGAFYDVDELLVRKASCLNPSAQNIQYPGIPVRWPNCLILYLGWKADDWTSVATIAGATEIAESDTTTGDDQGIVWDYVIQTSRAHIPPGVFTVTGGGSAVSRGAVLAIRCDRQAWTVTRAVNGWSGSHSVGRSLRLASTHAIAR